MYIVFVRVRYTSMDSYSCEFDVIIFIMYEVCSSSSLSALIITNIAKVKYCKTSNEYEAILSSEIRVAITTVNYVILNLNVEW